MCDPSHQSHTENAMVLLSPAEDFITHNFKSMDGSSDSDEHLVAAHVHASLTELKMLYGCHFESNKLRRK